MIEWISASGERFTPSVNVLMEFKGSVFSDQFIEAEIDFRDYTTKIKAYPTFNGKWEYEVTPKECKWSTIIAFNEWLSQRKHK